MVDKQPSELEYTLVLEIGATRTKLAWISSETINTPFKYICEQTKKFLFLQEQFAENVKKLLDQNKISNIRHIVASISGKIDSAKGLIVDGEALNRNAQ